jgi:hypothetical protein
MKKLAERFNPILATTTRMAGQWQERRRGARGRV